LTRRKKKKSHEKKRGKKKKEKKARSGFPRNHDDSPGRKKKSGGKKKKKKEGQPALSPFLALNRLRRKWMLRERRGKRERKCTKLSIVLLVRDAMEKRKGKKKKLSKGGGDRAGFFRQSRAESHAREKKKRKKGKRGGKARVSLNQTGFSSKGLARPGRQREKGKWKKRTSRTLSA